MAEGSRRHRPERRQLHERLLDPHEGQALLHPHEGRHDELGHGQGHEAFARPSDAPEWVRMTPMERYLGERSRGSRGTRSHGSRNHGPDGASVEAGERGDEGSRARLFGSSELSVPPGRMITVPSVTGMEGKTVQLQLKQDREGSDVVRRQRAKLDNYARHAVGPRKWLRIDPSGFGTAVTMEKLATARRLGVPLRDLRVLDPQLSSSYASAVLCRERAIVISLEQVRCIIGLDEVFVLYYDEEDVAPFVAELQHRLASACRQQKSEERSQDVVPFELLCVEVALEAVTKNLEGQMEDLEAAAHPALDALSHAVTTVNLERVRRIKSRMNRVKVRVERVREILEKYLEDDDDMMDMYLSRKAVIDERVHEILDHARPVSGANGEAGVSGRDADAGRGADAHAGGEAAADAGEGAGPSRTSSEGTGTEHSHSSGLSSPLASTSTRSRSSVESEVEEGIVDEVEMLLEAYFMQVDVLSTKLNTLGEYINDTEDYVNIKQDNQRNQLLMLEIVLTTATFCLAIISAVGAIFGMNLTHKLESSYVAFLVVTGVSCMVAVIAFLGIILFMRRRRLMLT